jgi:hypothetical protein
MSSLKKSLQDLDASLHNSTAEAIDAADKISRSLAPQLEEPQSPDEDEDIKGLVYSDMN